MCDSEDGFWPKHSHRCVTNTVSSRIFRGYKGERNLPESFDRVIFCVRLTVNDTGISNLSFCDLRIKKCVS